MELLNFISDSDIGIKGGGHGVGYIISELPKVLGSWKKKYDVVKLLKEAISKTDSFLLVDSFFLLCYYIKNEYSVHTEGSSVQIRRNCHYRN